MLQKIEQGVEMNGKKLDEILSGKGDKLVNIFIKSVGNYHHFLQENVEWWFGENLMVML